jgi:hypothetical protein
VRRRPIARAAVAVLAASTALVAGALPASADASTPLYVGDATGVNCSDSGAGTQTQPYCTISAAVAAVQPGQTINITGGYYQEHVTIAKSGTPGHPITLQGVQGNGPYISLYGGFTIDGQHDLSIIALNVQNTSSTDPGITVSHSTHITIQQVNVGSAQNVTTGTVSIQLTAVTDSSLIRSGAGGYVSTGLAMDAATTGILVKGGLFSANPSAGSSGGAAIDIAGPNNTVINTNAAGHNAAAITVEPGAANNIIANNIAHGPGGGISNLGANGTAITNNTVQNSCATGIRVAGASSGVSVQNNISQNNPRTYATCTPPADAVDIGVYDAAVNNTVVDYNTVYQSVSGAQPYAWNTPMSLADFQAASGQATHDIYSNNASVNDDSANSAAPGYQTTDILGHAREDNPGVPNTGAGPVTDADRGAVEHVVGPTAKLTITPGQPAGSVTADASGSTPGWTGISSYTFDFGDGSSTVTQSTPIATHRYSQRGTYAVTVTVTDTNSMTGTAYQPVPPWPDARVVVDFNGDGKIDIAGIDANNDLRLYAGTGAGKLTCGCGLMWPGGGQWGGFKHIVAGDFNGDGKIDIAGIDANNDLKLYTGDGTGKLTGGGTLMWPDGGRWAGFKQIS